LNGLNGHELVCHEHENEKARQNEQPNERAASWPERLRAVRVPLAVCAPRVPRLLAFPLVRVCARRPSQIVRNPQVQSWTSAPGFSLPSWSRIDHETMLFLPSDLLRMDVADVHLRRRRALVLASLQHPAARRRQRTWSSGFVRKLTGSDWRRRGSRHLAVHPIHVDAVTWVSASCEILFAISAAGRDAAAARERPEGAAPPLGQRSMGQCTMVRRRLLPRNGNGHVGDPARSRPGCNSKAAPPEETALEGRLSLRRNGRELSADTVCRHAPRWRGVG